VVVGKANRDAEIDLLGAEFCIKRFWPNLRSVYCAPHFIKHEVKLIGFQLEGYYRFMVAQYAMKLVWYFICRMNVA
jgi:hypothetical protein